MTYLAAHEWDRLGVPPTPGGDYASASLVGLAITAARAFDAADSEYRDAEYKRDEADEAEERADALTTEAREIVKQFAELHPALAKAVEDDPGAFVTAESVGRWLRDHEPSSVLPVLS
jgi:hypothetical protein